MCPIFFVSSVTGEGIGNLLKFISLIKNRNDSNHMMLKKEDPFEFDINENFLVPRIGVVVSGIIRGKFQYIII